MPNIVEYTSPVDGFRVSGVPAEAAAEAARARGAAGAAVGRAIGGGIASLGEPAQQQYEQGVVQPEISRGMTLGTTLADNLTSQWKTLANTTDPNDTSIRQKFLTDTLQPALDKFRAAFNTPEGQKFGTEMANRILEHFDTSTQADMSSRAGYASVANDRTALNNLSSMAEKDPSSLDFALEMAQNAHNSTIANSHLDAGVKASLDEKFAADQQDIVAGAMRGMAQANPAQFISDLDGGKFAKYDSIMGSKGMDAMRTYATEWGKAQLTDQKAQQAAVDKAQRQAIDGATTAVFTKYVKAAPDGSLSIDPGAFQEALKIGEMPGVKRTDVSSLISALRTIQHAQIEQVHTTSDPDVVANFSARMFLPDNDPNHLTVQDVLQAKAAGLNGEHPGLSDHDFDFFMRSISSKNSQMIADRKEFDTWFSGVKAYIDKSTPLTQDTPEARQRAVQFQMDKWQQFEARRAKGDSVQQSLQGLDSDINKYQITPKQAIQSMTAGMQTGGRSPLPPVKQLPESERWKPGESVQDFLNRTKAHAPTAAPDWQQGQYPKNFNERWGVSK